jgi:murein DD-endopeptidase MepM/ murein hydrolase activator NlpD
MLARLPLRGTDQYGSGGFGASRGNRKHMGVDLACYPGTRILSLWTGEVTKIGYPYHEHRQFRYVEVRGEGTGNHYRVFYISPDVKRGEFVYNLDKLGTAQDLTTLYPDITNHVHFEVKNANDEYVDPRPYL